MTANDVAWGFVFGCLLYGTFMVRGSLVRRWARFELRYRRRASDQRFVRRHRTW